MSFEDVGGTSRPRFGHEAGFGTGGGASAGGDALLSRAEKQVQELIRAQQRLGDLSAQIGGANDTRELRFAAFLLYRAPFFDTADPPFLFHSTGNSWFRFDLLSRSLPLTPHSSFLS
jgi:hypothetical protein